MESDVMGKWACSQCTYANFETAKACTMCRTPRYSVFITEPPCTSSIVNEGENCEQKWPCPDCTYLNVLKSRQCTVCMHKRPSNFDHDDMKLITEDECSVDLEQVEKVGKALQKWDCSQCTYKNWPNVKHCTMCGTPKDYVSIGIGNNTLSSSDFSVAGENGSSSKTEKIIEQGGFNVNLFLDVTVDKGDEHHDTEKTSNVNLSKRVTFLDIYLSHLHDSVDTGCASFLEACAELLRQSSDAETKLIHYIYHYGEGNRRISGFEAMLLSSIDEESTVTVSNRSIIDIIRAKNSRILASIPRFFMDSLSCTVAIPGLATSDSCDEIHKKIRENMYEDYDMTRVANNSALFTLPNAIYELRPWVASGESSLRVIMDLDERQVLDAVCCTDVYSLTGPLNYQTYAPLLLRNRGGGHSLVDAASQALWGVIDKSNTLRDALYHTLYAMETNFRSRWATSLMKLGLNFDIWMMQRHWSNIIECSEPGSSLEQIHVLVLAQVLNRPIIVFPIESSKLNPFPARDRHPGGLKHPVEGFYPQLPGLNNYRICPPLLLGYINGNFHALILPPRPVIERVEGRPSRIYRYIRCPPYPLTEYMQFIMDEKEAEDFVRENIVVDVDSNGQQWIYHSTFGTSHTKNDLGYLLWKDWIKAHFPKIIREECEVMSCCSVCSFFMLV
ncbi:unnamed protein product [Thelazia callipaeda]|uniref:Ubiquitinyl hydrolase 1 n=1 Tax=Thelazia callipaeda TaxID=103827 RepID=A0A0N5CK43_THECL|nr:unnamed protein product [Thelazia callipaeda]